MAMSEQKIHAPMACTVVDVPVAEGQAVHAGQTLLVLEAMKMEHELRAEFDGQVLQLAARPGELVAEGELLVRLGAPRAGTAAQPSTAAAAAPAATAPRADLQEVIARHAFTLDAQRPEAVAKRRNATRCTSAMWPSTMPRARQSTWPRRSRSTR